MNRVIVGSGLAMADDSMTRATPLSVSEFLAVVERSGILHDAEWREVQYRFGGSGDLGDSLALAHKLVEEGTLTEFQASRILRGKKLCFGRYVLLSHVGRGARGRVYKARHRLMDRVVALKVMTPDGELSEQTVSRFFREMKIVGLLDHPNLVRATDADVHEGCPYLVMEYLEGDDFEHVLARRGPLPPDEVIECMAQASRGLAHAHEKGVIHRDVKPTNMFLMKSGIVKVLDLGFGELVGMAKQLGNVFDTDENVVVGTTDFMSPEQVKNKPIDARTDLFSLGCTMYRLLTGVYAYPGLTREDRLIKRIRERPVPISTVRSGLSDNLVAIVDRLLAFRPADRFNSAAEAADALEALVKPAAGSERGKGVKPGATSPAAGAATPPVEPEAPLDWQMIESGLHPTGQGGGKASRLTDRNEPKPPSMKRLSSHRKNLEQEGIESGREAHQRYRNELIQMNRVMAELRAMEPKDQKDQAAPAQETWLERITEKLGDSLAEPSAAQILIAVLLVLLVLAGALAVAVG
jgi:serine/threonine-protein kinase